MDPDDSKWTRKWDADRWEANIHERETVKQAHSYETWYVHKIVCCELKP